MKYRLGDTVKIEMGVDLATSINENTLAYVLAGELPPSCTPQCRHVVLTTQELVDKYNEVARND